MWRKLPIVLLTKLMRKPYIVHLHAASERSVFVLTPKWLVRLIFLLSYRVVVLSDSWATVVKKHLPDARVTVIHNPVRKPQVARTPEPAGMVLFAGKLERRKGYMELLGAAAEVLKSLPNVTFCFLGHGEIEQAKAEAQLLNIEKSVSFPGWIGPEEIGDYYRRATVFCLPSFDEGLPMAVIEAMSYSLPVVTTPVGGLPDLISDGTDGLFAVPGDVHAIARQLLALLRNPERADRIGRNAALTIERTCNPVLIERQLLNLYQEVNAEWKVRRCGLQEGTALTMQVRR
jgi:glycosyltransferase involved in cell wall biosynthesis